MMYDIATCPSCKNECVKDRGGYTGIFECECGQIFSRRKGKIYHRALEEELNHQAQQAEDDWFSEQDQDKDWITRN